MKLRAAGGLQIVITIVVLAITIVFGGIILGMFQGAVPTSNLPSEAQTAISNTFTTVWNMWPLLTLVILVVIAAAIIGYLGVFRRGE